MSDAATIEESLDFIARLTRRDLELAKTLGDAEARYLVDAYYIFQEDRKRADAQVRALSETPEPNRIIEWLATQSSTIENQIKRVLDVYTQQHVMGSWMREITGIGPVIAAGLLAHIDIAKCPTVGHIWQFAGIAGAGQKPWKKGMVRPFNAKLKTLQWKLGQSFMKLSNHPNCYYGKIYRDRKSFEDLRNLDGYNAPEVKRRLEEGIGRPGTEAHKYLMKGLLPPAAIDGRARRYAVKLFLANMHQVWYERHFGRPAPLPYPIAILGHGHHILPPE